MIGIFQAIELIDGIDRDNVQIEGKHNIILLTDASARDDSLYQQVIDFANAQDKPNVTVHFFYSGNGCNGFGHYEDIKIANDGHNVKQIDAANFKAFATFVTSSYDDANSERKESSTPASCQYFQLYFVSRFSTLVETSRSSVTITKPDSSTQNCNIFEQLWGL